MKKLIVAAMIVAFASVSAFAADVVTYEGKKGTVTFNHKTHGDSLGCEACHDGEPAAIKVDKKAAHGATCKGCHKTKKAGPTKCKACHVK